MWQERIEVAPAILVGKPVIKGTRLTVEFLIDLMAEGWPAEQFLRSNPQLTADDLRTTPGRAISPLPSKDACGSSPIMINLLP